MRKVDLGKNLLKSVILYSLCLGAGCTKGGRDKVKNSAPTEMNSKDSQEKVVFGITEFQVKSEDQECSEKYSQYTTKTYPQMNVKNGTLCRELMKDYTDLEVVYYQMIEHDVPQRCKDMIKDQVNKVKAILINPCEYPFDKS